MTNVSLCYMPLPSPGDSSPGDDADSPGDEGAAPVPKSPGDDSVGDLLEPGVTLEESEQVSPDADVVKVPIFSPWRYPKPGKPKRREYVRPLSYSREGLDDELYDAREFSTMKRRQYRPRRGSYSNAAELDIADKLGRSFNSVPAVRRNGWQC